MVETVKYNNRNTSFKYLYTATPNFSGYAGTAFKVKEDLILKEIKVHARMYYQGKPIDKTSDQILQDLKINGQRVGGVLTGKEPDVVKVNKSFNAGDVIEVSLHDNTPAFNYDARWLSGELTSPRSGLLDNNSNVTLKGVSIKPGEWLRVSNDGEAEKYYNDDSHPVIELVVEEKEPPAPPEPDNNKPTLTLNTPQSQTVFENDNISIDGEAFDEDKGDVVIVKAKIADSRAINLATKVSDGKPFDFARTFLFKQGRVWQGNEPITSVLSDTSHKIEVWAEDDKGGKSKVETRTFSTTANRPPIVKVIKTPSLTNVTNSTPVEVAGTISDPDGHDVTMTIKLNDNPQEEIAIAGGEWSYIIKPSDLKEGVNEITIIGRDEYGMSHTKTVRISNTVYKADMSHVPSVALFDIPLEGVESDGAVMWLRRQSDNTQLEARVATAGKKEEDFHEMQKTSHVVGNTPRDQFAGQTGVKTNNVTIEVTSTGNHSLLMIQGVVK